MSLLQTVARKLRPKDAKDSPQETQQGPLACPVCGTPIGSSSLHGSVSSHNIHTCRLVNMALAEMGVSYNSPITIDIYSNPGPLKGYYTPTDPFTIHVSEDAYSLFPEYVIFHETKHLVDCMTKGWSEEDTPDPFARILCAKHGYKCPPPHMQPQWEQFGGISPIGSPAALPFAQWRLFSDR